MSATVSDAINASPRSCSLGIQVLVLGEEGARCLVLAVEHEDVDAAGCRALKTGADNAHDIIAACLRVQASAAQALDSDIGLETGSKVRELRPLGHLVHMRVMSVAVSTVYRN